MIHRTLTAKLKEVVTQFPAIGLLGPRQSGKTTLVKMLFPHYDYVNLEALDERAMAREDPKGFLARFRTGPGVIIDEIQNVPDLLSYIQIEIDEAQRAGQFILTGSQNILLNQCITQSLAGRIALLTLLPLSIEELREGRHLPQTVSEILFRGCYPRVYHSHLDPVVFAESYVRSYVEKDVRNIKNVTSLNEFQNFMGLCAGRIGQLLNISSLATEAGVSVQTVKSWISILSATYIIFLLQPHHANFNKRIVKMPKLYFYDTAIACHFLRISTIEDLQNHYLRGGLFESLLISNAIKNRFHHGKPSNVYFWRDKAGTEIDCLLDEGAELRAVEIKSTQTFNTGLLDGLVKWSKISGSDPKKGTLIYAGDKRQKGEFGTLIPWFDA